MAPQAHESTLQLTMQLKYNYLKTHDSLKKQYERQYQINIPQDYDQQYNLDLTTPSLQNNTDVSKPLMFQIQQQNRLLRMQILELETINGHLRNQLNDKQQSILKNQHNAMEQMSQEISILLFKNSLLQQQIASLRIINYSQSADNVKNKYQNSVYNVINSEQNKQNASKQNVNAKEINFIQSVQGMYYKIRNERAKDLKQIWRWLKVIALQYSSVQKWHNKYKQKLQNGPYYEELNEIMLRSR